MDDDCPVLPPDVDDPADPVPPVAPREPVPPELEEFARYWGRGCCGDAAEGLP